MNHWLRSIRSRTPHAYLVIGSAIVLAVLSLCNLQIATAHRLDRPGPVVSRQFLWHVIGGAMAIGLARVDYRRLLRAAPAIYLGSVATLVLTLWVGLRDSHASRWLWMPGLRVQPSEFAAVALVLALSRWESDHPASRERTLRDLSIPIAMMLVPFALVARQPDLGSATLIVLAAIPIVLMHPIRRGTLAGIVATGAAAVALFFHNGLYAYQRARLEAFLNPRSHFLDTGYQVFHANHALGAGGLYGRGIAAWRMLPPRFVPDVITDFPFAPWAFVTGAIGSLLVIGLFAVVALGGLRIARRSEDRFGAALAVGASSIWGAHALVNLGMTLGMLPAVGVTLPMFSYGGSGTVTAWMCVGLILSVNGAGPFLGSSEESRANASTAAATRPRGGRADL